MTSYDTFSICTNLKVNLKRGHLGLRHWCEQSDDVDSFGWTKHNGLDFGQQKIYDRGLKLTTEFVKKPENGDNGGEWSARIRVERQKLPEKYAKNQANSISMFFYAGMDEGGQGRIKMRGLDPETRKMGRMEGNTQTLGDFRIKLIERYESKKGLKFFHTATVR